VCAFVADCAEIVVHVGQADFFLLNVYAFHFAGFEIVRGSYFDEPHDVGTCEVVFRFVG
jgi:hypothetical protein